MDDDSIVEERSVLQRSFIEYVCYWIGKTREMKRKGERTEGILQFFFFMLIRIQNAFL